ncbi:MAG: regulatory protein RecX [Stenotrophobium sp.]
MPRSNKPREPASARDSALRALGRREHSARQLRRKLESRGYDEDTAAGTVNQLADRGWQSDSRYAEMLIRSRIGQGYGRLYIEGELRVAGVPDAEVSAAFEATECDWAQLAAEVHARKFGRAAATLAERNKQYRYLAGRGFSGEQIRKAMSGALPEDD